MQIESSIAAVREQLLADERVSAALLFGSAGQGRARAASDLDVALVARSPADLSVLEKELLDLAARLSLAAAREVQVVLLERADPVLGRQAFLGKTLFDRSPSRTAQLLERILIEYFDGEYHRRLRREALARRQQERHG